MNEQAGLEPHKTAQTAQSVRAIKHPTILRVEAYNYLCVKRVVRGPDMLGQTTDSLSNFYARPINQQKFRSI